MLFNSLTFLIFLPIVFALYWLLQSERPRYQNLLILVASYVFYGWWDWRFLSLIAFSSIFDYFIGWNLHRQERPGPRRALLVASLCVNLGLLGFFKYFDFFIHSFAGLLEGFGLHADRFTLRVILPVGISFYTFQTMSYAIDIYRRKLEPTRDFIAFLAFVSFFPQLVAGPIERASHLLPQFLRPRELDLDRAKDGLRQMLWGFFKKVMIADNLAPHVARIYQDFGSLPGSELAIGTFFFAIQIYCDFSGYSDIAVGCGRLFGIDLMRNFAFPYFSRDIAEFWRRWHISLSSWFRDYVYIPLGGSRTSRPRRIANIVATFTISGLWHGANWTFVVWGFLNGLYYIPLMLSGQERRHTDIVAAGRLIPSLGDAARVSATFGITLVAWVFFRSDTVANAFAFLARMGTATWLARPNGELIVGLFFSFLLLFVEWLRRSQPHALSIGHLPTPVRWSVYAAVSVAILVLGNFGEVQFIYFQF